MTDINEQREMYFEIREYDKEIQKRKLKRNLLYCFSFSAVIFYFIFQPETLKTNDWILSLLLALIISCIFGFLYFYINMAIFSHFFHVNQIENECLEAMKKSYRDKYDATWH